MPIGFPWFSLDSLVQILTYQWVTRHKPIKSSSRRFCPYVGSARNLGMLKSRIVHGQSLPWFLIYRKQLLS
jgi:hypothetical protein